MIRPLRQRHRVMVCALGVLLPVGFVAGIKARQPLPVTRSLPAQLETSALGFGTVVWTRTDVWPERRILTTLRRNAAGFVAVELTFRDLVKPDVLVYWASARGKDAVADKLPDHARLLGTLSNRRPLPIPPNADGGPGRLILYSLANHEVIATSNPFTI